MSQSPRDFRVDAEAGQALLATLRGWLPGESWSSLKRLIASRRVQVSGNLCLDAGRRLAAGELVRLLPHPAAAPPTADEVTLRYLDEWVVVAEKPAGMTSVRHRVERRWSRKRKQLQPTLDECVQRQVAARLRCHRTSQVRLYPVHRLDRDTSGLLVLAGTPHARNDLMRQFREHTTHRRYQAVVLGKLTTELTCQSYLVRDRGDGRRGVGDKSPEAKWAVTHVRPIEQYAHHTLVECRLETGRTHQIRIHLSEAGHPLCGDKLYRGPFSGKPIPDRSHAPRLALHAGELGFQHPETGQELLVKMPLPADLVEFVARLKGELPRPRRAGR